MKTQLKLTLWVNAVVAEVGAALALFGHNNWPFVDEFTGGYWLLVGLEMALLAGLATWAALQKAVNKLLLWGVLGLNLLMIAFFLFVLETSTTLSTLTIELLLIDIVVLVSCTVVEWRSNKSAANLPVVG